MVDRVLDFRLAPGDPPAAAQFLCKKLYQEFATFPVQQNSVRGCADHFADHQYDVSFALDYVFEDPVFKTGLGTKKRWPLAVLLGDITDFDISINQWQFRDWAEKVGMKPFEPQDVSGWSLENVWTSNRISEAHNFLTHFQTREMIRSIKQWHFRDRLVFQAQYLPYLIPGTTNKYSFVTKLCPEQDFIEMANQEDNAHVIDADDLFAMYKYPSKKARYDKFKAAQENALSNVCQFIA